MYNTYYINKYTSLDVKPHPPHQEYEDRYKGSLTGLVGGSASAVSFSATEVLFITPRARSRNGLCNGT